MTDCEYLMIHAELERVLAPYPDLLTVAEVATILRVHPRSVQRWAQEGRVAAVRLGRRYCIPRAAVLQRMLESIRAPELADNPPLAAHDAAPLAERND